MRKERAFTLIELIIVIVIISILAAITASGFINMRKEANIARCKADGTALKSAIKSFHAHRALKDQCERRYNATKDCWPIECTPRVLGGYIQKFPPEPDRYLKNGRSWNENYNSDTGFLNIDEACNPEPKPPPRGCGSRF